MSAFSVRPYRESDRGTLLDIAVAAWTPIFASFEALLGPDLFAVAFPEWQADKRRQIASACAGEYGAVVIVAEAGGQPVGFVSYYMDADTGVGEISNNAVHPEHQGHGIATRLYGAALAGMRAAGMRVAKVSTGGDDSHAPARRAYAKAGFARALPGVTYYQMLTEEDEA